jgi:hypothetical protein
MAGPEQLRPSDGPHRRVEGDERVDPSSQPVRKNLPRPLVAAVMSRRRQDVRVWNFQDRGGRGRNVQPWVVRWVVDGKQSSRSFRSCALADRFRASILLAHDDGEEFDRASGEPVSRTPLPGDTQIGRRACLVTRSNRTHTIGYTIRYPNQG